MPKLPGWYWTVAPGQEPMAVQLIRAGNDLIVNGPLPVPIPLREWWKDAAWHGPLEVPRFEEVQK